MKLIECPILGPRPESEFVFGGDVRIPPKQDDADDKQWAAYVFNRDGAPGVKREWWYHGSSGIWFVFERNTLTNEFLRAVNIAEVQHGV